MASTAVSTPMQDHEGYFAVLIGDIARSRSFEDQQELFNGLKSHFKWVNQYVEAEQALELGFEQGDEFQAAYRSIESAVKASILLRMRFKLNALKPKARDMDVRVGLGYGQITAYDKTIAPRGQSGDAWWNAREAIEEAESRRGQHGMPKSINTRFKGSDPGIEGFINAMLLAVDQVLYRMDRRGIHITLALLQGEQQKAIARQLNTSQSTISRSAREQGANTIKAIFEELGGVDFS
ncbi:MAG: SatD family protein [Congregibacter sp.]